MTIEGSTIIEGSETNIEQSRQVGRDCLDIFACGNSDDAAIKATVLSCLIWHAHVPLEDITVNVYLGYVTLDGTVPWLYQKHVIAAMVKNLRGVNGLVNNIQVSCKLAYPYS